MSARAVNRRRQLDPLGKQIFSMLKPEAQQFLSYRTSHGQAFLTDTLSFLPPIKDDSIDLILTSPPFALKRKKEYGNEDEDKEGYAIA